MADAAKKLEERKQESALFEAPIVKRPAVLKCRPFIKWAGGKSQLIDRLMEHVSRVPSRFQNYFEPFVGGGALFFEIKPRHAFLSDVNPELINAYTVVRDKLELLLEDLRRHEHSSEYYYRIRDLDRQPDFDKRSDVERASRFIYLNKTCFNGLYRVNSKGQFNVPFGDYVSPAIADESNLRACSEVLKESILRCESFLKVEDYVSAGDFVYFDPPYAPRSATASFTTYFKGGFTLAMQKELRDLCDRLDQKGVYFLLSNSYTDFILGLYQRFNLQTVHASRAINSKAGGRGKVMEVVVTNY